MTGKIDDYKTQLVKAEAEVARLKQSNTTQDLTFRVIQERLLFTTNEAEKYKKLAQDKITELSSFCAEFLRKASHDFELENDFEKSRDVIDAEKECVLIAAT